MPRLTSDRGQSTVEYVGVLALLVVIISAAGATAMAPTYANAAIGGFQRALCIVTGRACRSLDEQACVVRSNGEGHTLSATIFFVRLEDGRLMLQERLSDGRIRITVTSKSGIGGEMGVGASAGVDFKGVRLDASAKANAALLGLVGRGKVYIARDAGEAQRLVRAIEDDKAREPDASFYEGGLRGEASATASAGAGLGGKDKDRDTDKDGDPGEEEKRESSTSPAAETEASLGTTLEGAVGHRVDRHTGETTWYLRADAEATASASASVIGVGKAGASASSNITGLVRVITDRRGRVVEVGALATYGGGAEYEVTNGPKGKAGGNRREIEITADPDDPSILAALGDLRRHPGAGAMKALTTAIYERGRVDRRTYEAGSDHDGINGSVALGAKVAAGYDQTSEHAKLIDAETRPPGGLWEKRFDCVDRA